MFKTSRSQRGMLLLEVLIAILIFSIGLLGMVLMQAVSSSNSTNAEDRTNAALLADDMIADLWTAKPASLATYLAADCSRAADTWTVLVAKLGGGSGTCLYSVAGTNQVTVTIKWNPKGRKTAIYGTTAGTYGGQQAVYSTQVVIQ